MFLKIYSSDVKWMLVFSLVYEELDVIQPSCILCNPYVVQNKPNPINNICLVLCSILYWRFIVGNVRMLMFVKETLQLIEIDGDEQADSNTEQCLWTNKWWVLAASVKSCHPSFASSNYSYRLHFLIHSPPHEGLTLHNNRFPVECSP